MRTLKKILREQLVRHGIDVRRVSSSDEELYSGYPSSSLKCRKFYNVGAGSFRHRYWTNLDFATEYYRNDQEDFIEYDLMSLNPLPLDDRSTELIYTSHTIEHVTDAAVLNLLRESYRALKDGGAIRLTAPDMGLAYAAYKRRDIGYWHWGKDILKSKSKGSGSNQILEKVSIHQLFLQRFASQVSLLDMSDVASKKYTDEESKRVFEEMSFEKGLDFFSQQCVYDPTRPGRHINWWTHEKLISMLRSVGFAQVYRSGYGQSALPPMRDIRFFDNTHPEVSLYVEAIR